MSRNVRKVWWVFTALFLLMALKLHSLDFSYAASDLLPYSKSVPQTNAAQYFNKAGFAEYQKRAYQKAAALFLHATNLDSLLVVAHWNFSCSLALLRTADPCDLTYESDIDEHLSAAIALEPARRAKLATDSDLKSVRNLPFFVLLALDPNTDIATLLTRIPTWFGPKPGVFPSSPTVTFFRDGEAGFTFFDAAGETRDTPGFMPPLSGTWSIYGNNISGTIYWPEPKSFSATVHLKTEGFFVTELWIETEWGTLSYFEDPCSA